LLDYCRLNGEIVGLVNKNLNQKESQVSIAISLEKSYHIIGAVLRKVVLILIKNLWHVNDSTVTCQ
jgi:hypothetical protein